MVLISLRRSKKRSAFASGLSEKEYRTPACSPTKSRSLPAQRARSKGCSNFSRGKARTTLKGGGGSGEPMTREVVQGIRADDSAAAETSQATNPATSTDSNTDRPIDRRRPPWKGDGMSTTPEDILERESTGTPGE